MRNLLLIAVAAGAVVGCGSREAADQAGLEAYKESKGVKPSTPTGPADAATTAAQPDPEPPPAPRATRVQVTVVSAQGIPDYDDGPGETDGYVVLDYDGETFETSVAEGTLEPKWEDSFVFHVRAGATLRVTLKDKDSFSSETIGVSSEQLPTLLVGETKVSTVQFRGGDSGTLELRLTGLE